MGCPTPGSDNEQRALACLQEQLRPLFESIFPNRLEPRTVVVVPSLSLNEEIISRINRPTALRAEPGQRAARIAAMCAGRVRQQPPSRRAPRARQSRAASPKPIGSLAPVHLRCTPS